MTRSFAGIVGSLLIALSGCYVDAGQSDGVPYRDGALLLDWTIDGYRSPFECRRSATDSVAILIETARGRPFDEYYQDCEAFGASIVLPPGDYVATVVLLDAAGYDRTTPVVAPFRIYEGYDSELPVDFPADAFF